MADAEVKLAVSESWAARLRSALATGGASADGDVLVIPRWVARDMVAFLDARVATYTPTVFRAEDGRAWRSDYPMPVIPERLEVTPLPIARARREAVVSVALDAFRGARPQTPWRDLAERVVDALVEVGLVNLDDPDGPDDTAALGPREPLQVHLAGRIRHRASEWQATAATSEGTAQQAVEAVVADLLVILDQVAPAGQPVRGGQEPAPADDDAAWSIAESPMTEAATLCGKHVDWGRRCAVRLGGDLVCPTHGQRTMPGPGGGDRG